MLDTGDFASFSFEIFAPSNPLAQTRQSSAQSSSNISLSFTGNPSVLPADGGTYSALVLEFVNSTSGAPYIPQSIIYDITDILQTADWKCPK